MNLNQKIAAKLHQQEGVTSPYAPPGSCAWIANGEQCWFPGNCSHSLLGGGPYYCRFHVWPTKPSEAAEIVTRSHDKTAREKYYSPRKDIETEARRSGESQAECTQRLREAVRVGLRKLQAKQQPARQREPGDDDE